MKSLILGCFLLLTVHLRGQQFSETYSQTRSVDEAGNVIEDWHEQENTFIFNVNGTNDIIWQKSSGKQIMFTFLNMTSGYDEDGYYYENYNVSTWNPEFGEEEILDIKRYVGNGLLLLVYWDGTDGFLQ